MYLKGALLTPKVASNDLVLQLAMAYTMRGDYGELDNQHKGYLEFVNDYKLYHIIITRYALDLWFSNAHNCKHFIFLQSHMMAR